MDLYSHAEILDSILGPVGTRRRQKHDEAVDLYILGEKLKQIRLSQNLTQEQLERKVGIDRRQISRLENGHDLTLRTMMRILRALGISSSLEMQGIGSIALT